MNILIACEESQRVCISFRDLGHCAFSCDLKSCSGGHPEWHIKGDVLSLIDGYTYFKTEDELVHFIPSKWDLIIAHPPCTYLCNTGSRWFSDKYGEAAQIRKLARADAIDFFYKFVHANCDRIAIENPVGCMSSLYRKPDQIISPWMFGEPENKRTCLWLFNLPKLNPTKIIPVDQRNNSIWLARFDGIQYSWNDPRVSELRSKTFWGIARAMASQWGFLSC